jgi:hypothetical protein
MRNRNPDSETRFGFRIKKCAPALKGVGMIRAEIGLKNRKIINETYSFQFLINVKIMILNQVNQKSSMIQFETFILYRSHL